MDQQQRGSQPTKVERKIVERNRRNQMKINLHSKLYSILPSYNPKEWSKDL
ncbi:hypothetical protein glysoja_001377 [Glycine soja]|nr:hypothetical protein glysoja_001377 [Glycine soja]